MNSSIRSNTVHTRDARKGIPTAMNSGTSFTHRRVLRVLHIYSTVAAASPYTTNAAHSLTVHPSRSIQTIAA